MILREGGSVRRAEELSRRFKKTMHRSKPSDGFNTKTVNESIDNMAAAICLSIGENVNVKMRLSRVETAIHIVLKGNPEETETQIQKIYDLIVGVPKPEVQTEKEEEIKTQESPTENTYSNPFEPMLEKPSYNQPSDPIVPRDPDNLSEY